MGSTAARWLGLAFVLVISPVASDPNQPVLTVPTVTARDRGPERSGGYGFPLERSLQGAPRRALQAGATCSHPQHPGNEMLFVASLGTAALCGASAYEAWPWCAGDGVDSGGYGHRFFIRQPGSP